MGYLKLAFLSLYEPFQMRVVVRILNLKNHIF